jgi:phosphohistidine phosphatase
MTEHRVYLVRHAKAEPSQGDDAARRLTAEGRARFAQHVRALADRLEIARVLTSPYRRARETAALLARATGAPVALEPRLASGESGARELLELAREVGAGVALVGHNPEIAEALARLAGKDLEVEPGAVAALEVTGEKLTLAWLEGPAAR